MSTSANENQQPSEETTWKLPNGIDNHIYSGIINSAIASTAGGALGTVFFKSGKGWRTACAAVGLGVAIGSTVERAIYETSRDDTSK